MDVVRSSIEGLSGTVEVMSVKGKGTTITLKLPFTLAIIDGLLVNIANESFVIPLGAVVECVELTEEGRKRAHRRNHIKVREDIIPYIPLREVFSINGGVPLLNRWSSPSSARRGSASWWTRSSASTDRHQGDG